MASPFYTVDDQKALTLAPGVTARFVTGEQVMLAFLTLVPGGQVLPHSHLHEQLGTCLEGEFLLTVDGVEHLIKPGEAYSIPSGVVHSARAAVDGAGARALDVFVPVREDYLAKVREL